MSFATELFEFSIINGENAAPTEFPHMVALGYPNNKNGYDFDCGASLIADRWLVTAAHCIKDRRKPVIARMGKVQSINHLQLKNYCSNIHIFFLSDHETA